MCCPYFLFLIIFQACANIRFTLLVLTHNRAFSVPFVNVYLTLDFSFRTRIRPTRIRGLIYDDTQLVVLTTAVVGLAHLLSRALSRIQKVTF